MGLTKGHALPHTAALGSGLHPSPQASSFPDPATGPPGTSVWALIPLTGAAVGACHTGQGLSFRAAVRAAETAFSRPRWVKRGPGMRRRETHIKRILVHLQLAQWHMSNLSTKKKKKKKMTEGCSVQGPGLLVCTASGSYFS